MNYLLFASDSDTMPEGGWWDFIGIYDSMTSAAEVVDGFNSSDEYREFWWHVVDLERRDICLAGYGRGTKEARPLGR